MLGTPTTGCAIGAPAPVAGFVTRNSAGFVPLPRSLITHTCVAGVDGARAARRGVYPDGAPAFTATLANLPHTVSRTQRPALAPYVTQTHRRAGLPPLAGVHIMSVTSVDRVLNGVDVGRSQLTPIPGAAGRWYRPVRVAAMVIVPPGSRAMR